MAYTEVKIRRFLVGSFWCCLASFFIFAIFLPTLIRYALALHKDSLPYKAYVEPPVTTKMSIYLFNISNYAQYKSAKNASEKDAFQPEFEQIGPIVYDMRRQRQNLTQNGRYLTSQILDQFTLNIAASKLKESDTVATVSLSKYLQHIMQDGDLFDEISVADLLWDENFGLFKDTNNRLQKPTTINTGIVNPFSTYKLVQIDGKTTGFYGKGCNSLRGTYEGVGFAPMSISNRVYFEPFGRNIALKFKHYSFSRTRYEFDSKAFDMNLYRNRCYNQLSKYDGAMQMPDIDGNSNPAFLSYPHFLYSKDERLTKIPGMLPDKDRHKSYFVIEPMSGIPVEVAIRLQINIFSKKYSLIPVIWTEIVFELDDEMSFKVKFLHLILLYIPLAVSLAFFVVASLFIYHSFARYRRNKVGYIQLN